MGLGASASRWSYSARICGQSVAGVLAAEAAAGDAKPKTAKKAAPAASAPLTLAERLGLRAPGGPREGDDNQEVGPTK